MCGRPAWGIERLFVTCGQIERPLRSIERIDRIALQRDEAGRRLQRGHRRIGVVEHNVVRVDEVDGQEPGLSGRCEVPALATQPADSHCGDNPIVQVSATVMRDDVAHAEIIGETVGFHLGGKDLGGHTKLLTVSNSLVRCHLPL